MDTVPNKEEAAQSQFGFWSSLAMGILTLGTLVIGVATPPLSGPFCRADCFQYPYLDVAGRFPRDYFWMFPAIVSTLLYVAFTIGLHSRSTPRQRPLAQFGLVLAAMAGLTLIGDYFVQLAVVQPSLIAREPDGISMLTQFNPHGLFIALEELGYLLMSLSLACMALASPRTSRLERAVRWTFLGGFAATTLLSVWIVTQFGHAREYRFEVAIISINWLLLIAGGLMMAFVFRRDLGAARAGQL